jgi:hypothetical protein
MVWYKRFVPMFVSVRIEGEYGGTSREHRVAVLVWWVPLTWENGAGAGLSGSNMRFSTAGLRTPRLMIPFRRGQARRERPRQHRAMLDGFRGPSMGPRDPNRFVRHQHGGAVRPVPVGGASGDPIPAVGRPINHRFSPAVIDVSERVSRVVDGTGHGASEPVTRLRRRYRRSSCSLGRR